MVMVRQVSNMIILPVRPVVQLIPAASEAIITEKGLMVEHIDPIEEPKKMQAKPTISSYFAAMKMGIKIGKKAMVSSARPKVVPPAAIKVVTRIISRYSLPYKALPSQEIPASKAPVLFIIPMSPPMISTKKMISEAAIIPLIGDLMKAAKPCGFDSNFWKVSGILMGL